MGVAPWVGRGHPGSSDLWSVRTDRRASPIVFHFLTHMHTYASETSVGQSLWSCKVSGLDAPRVALRVRWYPPQTASRDHAIGLSATWSCSAGLAN